MDEKLNPADKVTHAREILKSKLLTRIPESCKKHKFSRRWARAIAKPTNLKRQIGNSGPTGMDRSTLQYPKIPDAMKYSRLQHTELNRLKNAMKIKLQCNEIKPKES